jgi:hypothetical protein
MALHYLAPRSSLTLHYDDASGSLAQAPVLMLEISDAQRAVTGWIVAPEPDQSGATLHVGAANVRRIDGVV